MSENTNDSRTELSDLGEFGLIKHLAEHISLKNKSSVKGIGDDAAVIDNNNLQTIVSTDMLVEGIHFDLTYVPLKHLGYKAIAVNVSDICAMNAKASQVTVSLALSNRFSLEAVEELYAGMLIACEKYGVDIVGGDTSSSLSGLVISITAIGSAKKEDIVYRNGATENDLICVSGDLGSAYLGLQLLEREKAIFKENPSIQPMLKGYDYILQRQLRPEARVDIIQKLAAANIKPTAMIDISDGLASEVIHLCEESKKGCSLFEDKIPFSDASTDVANEFGLPPSVCALNGGEDYELLFTVSLSDFEKLKAMQGVTVVGHITDQASGMNLVARDNSVHPLTAQGWDAFISSRKEEQYKNKK